MEVVSEEGTFKLYFGIDDEKAQSIFEEIQRFSSVASWACGMD